MNDSSLWNNRDKAKEITIKLKHLKDTLNRYKEADNICGDLLELLEIAEEDDIKSLEVSLERLEELVDTLVTESLLSGENDESNAYLSIHPGAGGTESCDWAAMLLRMYTRWCEKKGYEYDILDYQKGDEAGIKDATIFIKGPYAYGYLKSEFGVHRLVRISPFDANHRRHTSFASVFVYPEEDTEIDIEINEKDLKIDTFRSSGPGGQNVNKVNSAVRITHIPTGIVASCQTQRSQHQNKEMAMRLLKMKLYEYYLKQNESVKDSLEKEKKEIAWGNQVRSYVFHPYQKVKDHRTGVEVSDVQRVMDGDIDPFIKAYLRYKATVENK